MLCEKTKPKWITLMCGLSWIPLKIKIMALPFMLNFVASKEVFKNLNKDYVFSFDNFNHVIFASKMNVRINL